MYKLPSMGGLAMIEPSDRSPVEKEISPKVMELDLEELYQANRMLNDSRALYHLNNLQELLDHGYKLNALEQRLLDKFYENYNVNYKSPLAVALKEE